MFFIFARNSEKTMKKSIFFAIFILFAGVNLLAQDKTTEPKVQHLTYQEFIDKVWDFEKSPKEFIFKGKTPAIVDFYADWCGPCRKVGPIMEKLAEEYDGKLLIYKVNTQNEGDLAKAFQIRSIPSVLFIPMEGQPMMQVGALPEEGYRQVLEERLLK